ncbi:hypothetical protein [Corallococcus sp. EGB]|uniref:hypothetical protein n=1 Tax=Corallococcus sp. EGB TaxID=1521117 RepID=UPI001CC174F4|nr:hypothetical protein [Corallococcus sp. EGB]
MAPRIAALLPFLALCACSSASGNFVGEYDSVATPILTSNGETTQGKPIRGTLTIVEGKGADTVIIKDSDCDIGAAVKSDTTCQVVSKYCPPKEVGDCEVPMNVSEETGTLSSDKLVIELAGTNTAVCPDGSTTNSFALRIDATTK